MTVEEELPQGKADKTPFGLGEECYVPNRETHYSDRGQPERAGALPSSALSIHPKPCFGSEASTAFTKNKNVFNKWDSHSWALSPQEAAGIKVRNVTGQKLGEETKTQG